MSRAPASPRCLKVFNAAVQNYAAVQKYAAVKKYAAVQKCDAETRDPEKLCSN
jgi:hypothetical protein